MQVRAFVVADSFERDMWLDANAQRALSGKSFSEILLDKDYTHRHISTVSLAYDRWRDQVYCGLTAFDADLLYAFDPATKRFRSLGFQRVADAYDVKIHRSLIFDSQGTLYLATAGLIDLDNRNDAPGGKVLRYFPDTNAFEVLGIPIAHDYIQTIVLDERRSIIYGFTYPGGHAFRFDLATRQGRDLAYTQGGPHTPALDDEGNLWGCWAPLGGPCAGTTTLLKYEPDSDRLTWFRKALPTVGVHDTAGIDSMVNGGDGYLYVGTTAGALVRVDPRTGDSEYLCHPAPGSRFAGILVGHDGLIYGSTGTFYETHLVCYDRKTKQSYDLGRIYDPERKTGNWTTHALTEGKPGTFYVGETDNPERSGYVWECVVY